MPEREIERKLCESVKAMGGMCIKQTGMAGIPDRLILLPGGQAAFVELKATGKKPRKLQQMRMKQLCRLGFRCFVIDSIQQVADLLHEFGGGAG